MATRQTSKHAKNKAEAKVDTGAANRPGAKNEREPLRRNPRVESRSVAARTDRAGATVSAAPKANHNGSEVRDNREQARSRSKPTAPRADLGTASANGGEGEERISGVTGGSGPGVNQQNSPTRIYIIGNDGITLCREPPIAVNEGEVVVASSEELHAARVNGKRLLALWNALPGVEKRRKIGDRDALIDQLWSAIEMLPDPEPQSDAKRASKQEAVIAMLRRPEGVTVDEVASATGWQRHTVRGIFSGTLKKKLGLTLASAKEERGRVYRIAESTSP